MFQGSAVHLGQRECNGYQRVTSLTPATALTVPAGTRLVILQPETKSVRWRDDGTNPTASIGMIMAANDVFIYTGEPSRLRFIEVEASAVLNVSYYK